MPKMQMQKVVSDMQHVYLNHYSGCFMPSVIWRCWLDDRKGIWPVKNWVVGCWCGYLSGARCRFAYGPADANATQYFCSSKSRLVLPFWYRLTRVVPDKGPLNRCCCCTIQWMFIPWLLMMSFWSQFGFNYATLHWLFFWSNCVHMVAFLDTTIWMKHGYISIRLITYSSLVGYISADDDDAKSEQFYYLQFLMTV